MTRTTQVVWTATDGVTPLLVAKTENDYYVSVGSASLERLCELGLAISDAIRLRGMAPLAGLDPQPTKEA